MFSSSSIKISCCCCDLINIIPTDNARDEEEEKDKPTTFQNGMNKMVWSVLWGWHVEKYNMGGWTAIINCTI